MSDDDLTQQSPAAEGPDLPTSADLDLADGLAEPAAPSAGRLALAVLASLVVAVLGVVIWVVVTLNLENQYVGVSVVMGLLVGYVMRVVSRRSSIPVRVVASLVTAIGAAGGTLAGEAAYYSAKYSPSLSNSWDKIVGPHMWKILKGQKGLTYVVYGAAVVIAYLAAGPQKPKKPAVLEGPADLVDETPTEATEPVAEPVAETATEDDAG